SASPRGDGNQDGSLRAALASVRRAADRHDSARIPRQDLFWTTVDLETKLLDFQHYYNGHRTHAGLEGRLPEPGVDGSTRPMNFDSYNWRKHCRGLFQTPIAA